MVYHDEVNCCADEDECDRSRGQVCPQNSRCENTYGSFRCVCDPGFQLNIATTTCEGQYTVNQLHFSTALLLTAVLSVCLSVCPVSHTCEPRLSGSKRILHHTIQRCF